MKTRTILAPMLVLGLLLAWGGLANGSTVLGTGTGSLVGSDLTDIGDDGLEGSYAPPDLAGFDAVFFSSDEPGFGGGEFAFNVFDNTLGPGNDKWCCGTAFPQIVGADFSTTLASGGNGIQLERFTVSSANDTAGRDPTVWRIEGSNDTTTGLDGTWTTIYDHPTGGSDWAARLQVNSYSPADGDTFLTSEPFKAFRMVTDETGLTGGAFFQLGEIELFGTVVGPPGPPGSQYDQVVLADNPIAYYRFSETSGPTAADATGGGNDGTYIGAANLGADGPMPPDFPGFEAGNSATGFNNTDAAVNTPVSLSGLGEFTIEAWVRPTAAQDGRTGLVGQNDAIEFGFINDTTIQMWNPGIGALNVAYDSGANADEWIHLVGVGTGTEKQIWINGVLAGTQSHGATTDYGTSGFLVNVGGDGIFDGSGNWFEGDIDEVALYNTALSAEQIQAHWQASLTAGQAVPEPSTLALAALGLLGLGIVGWRRRR